MSCLHETVEPVVVAGETQPIATVCSSCLQRLPVNWGCEDCEYDELFSFAQLEPVARVMSLPCRRHRVAG